MPSEPFVASIARVVRLAVDEPPAESGRPIVITAAALPWNTVIDLNWTGDTAEFAPGSVTAADPARVPFLADHDNHPFGYGVAFTAGADGLTATMAIPREELDDARTATVVRQMRNGVRTAVSVGVALDDVTRTEKGDHDHYVVNRGRLLELSSVVLPRFDDARITSIAASKGESMPTTFTDGLPTFPTSTPVPMPFTAAGQPAPPDDPAPDDGGGDLHAAAEAGRHLVEAGARRHPANVIPYQPRTSAGPDLSLAAVSRALAATGGDPRMIKAALTNVISTDVAGVVRPQYMDELLGLLTLGTPVINVFRQGNITSNPIIFPKWGTLPTVGKQATEKTQVPSGAATITSLSISVETHAGANDVSRQSLDFSNPSFMEAYFQACTEMYARDIENVFETALLGAATAIGVGPYTDLVSVIANMIGRLAGKGLPGTFVLLVSGDVFGMMFQKFSVGGPGIWGIVNANFPTPPVVVAPYFPAGTIVGAMTGAAISFQNAAAPLRLSAVEVDLLGLQLGVFGYFAAATLYASGLFKAAMTVPAPTAGEPAMDAAAPDDTGFDLLNPPAAPASGSTKKA